MPSRKVPRPGFALLGRQARCAHRLTPGESGSDRRQRAGLAATEQLIEVGGQLRANVPERVCVLLLDWLIRPCGLDHDLLRAVTEGLRANADGAANAQPV